MNAHIGHNNPPDPLEEALAPFFDAIAEAENWLDGETVKDEAQMGAVDLILKDIKAAEKAVKGAEETEAKPLYEAWKSVKARYAPTLEDLGRLKKGLVALVDACKRRLAAEKAEAERRARAEAEKARREAEEAARAADASNIEAVRAAAEKQQAAELAQAQLTAASKDKVRGLRTVTRYEVTDQRALLHWIAKNDRDAIVEFVEEYARRNHRNVAGADGLKVWTEKEAY